MLYVDVQNVYNHQADQAPLLIRESDANGVPLTDPLNSLKYVPKYLNGEAGTILPTIGIMIEF
jgi:hypothetical protein